MVQQLCTRNRTKDSEDARDETQGLDEIDREVTEAGAKKMNPEDRTILEITRKGSSWTRVAAYWAGQAEDRICQNCHEAEEDANHFWSCKALKAAREEADKELADLGPEILPQAVKQGIAPAISANSCGAFWGDCNNREKASRKQWKLIGGDAEKKAHPVIRESLRKLEPRTKAREVMQYRLQPKGWHDLPNPKWIDEESPEKPNVYSDGSVKNPRSAFCQIGGVGVWWPNRKIETMPLETAEIDYMFSEETDFGVRGWNTFNNLKNSSTRTEIGASLLAMIPGKAANIGIDSLSTIIKGTAIIDHTRRRNEAKLRDEEGALLLGGEVTPLHRESPWKKCWQLMKDGDLWGKFMETVKAKNPKAVKLTKVKGHATEEMVESNLVEADDKHGNDQADTAAEKGTDHAQNTLTYFANFYQRRQSEDAKFMERVQRFIVQTKKAEKKLRTDRENEPQVVLDKNHGKFCIPKVLKYEQNMGNTMKLKLRQPRRQEYKDEEGWKKATSVASFLLRTRWCAEEKEAEKGTSGITWLELFYTKSMGQKGAKKCWYRK